MQASSEQCIKFNKYAHIAQDKLYTSLLSLLRFTQRYTVLTYLLFMLPLAKLTKLIASHDLLCSMVTNQIAFDHQDSKSISTCNFECVMKQCCQALVSKLETLDTINFN